MVLGSGAGLAVAPASCPLGSEVPSAKLGGVVTLEPSRPRALLTAAPQASSSSLFPRSGFQAPGGPALAQLSRKDGGAARSLGRTQEHAQGSASGCAQDREGHGLYVWPSQPRNCQPAGEISGSGVPVTQAPSQPLVGYDLLEPGQHVRG